MYNLLIAICNTVSTTLVLELYFILLTNCVHITRRGVANFRQPRPKSKLNFWKLDEPDARVAQNRMRNYIDQEQILVIFFLKTIETIKNLLLLLKLFAIIYYKIICYYYFSY